MIHLWDILTHSVVWSNDVGEQAQSACFSPDGEVIVIGTVTGKWVVLDATTREVFGVHQDGGEPVHVAKFSPDGSLLALGSRDNAIYTYQVKDIDILRDIEWATADCVVSWTSLGIWGETLESPDVVTASGSRNKELLASGDNSGRVRLYSFPVTQHKLLG